MRLFVVPWSLQGRARGAQGSILVSWSAALGASGCIFGRSGAFFAPPDGCLGALGTLRASIGMHTLVHIAAVLDGCLVAVCGRMCSGRFPQSSLSEICPSMLPSRANVIRWRFPQSSLSEVCPSMLPARTYAADHTPHRTRGAIHQAARGVPYTTPQRIQH